MTEYWQPVARCLEQGWEVEERPEGDELLVFELVIDATHWTVDADALGADLVGPDGGLWRYEGLEVWDATGHGLDAWMEATDDGLALVVDDRGATYPITVDPTLVQAAKLYAQEPVEDDKLGYSVGGGGDTNGDGFDEVFLGALTDGGNGTNSGTVYIFLGSAD
ncbi:MAG: hypothetical protein GY913_05005, partial [Proteobacteria bacterium]|nr:hypothetical protein [Pseudomonadota bacterium]